MSTATYDPETHVPAAYRQRPDHRTKLGTLLRITSELPSDRIMLADGSGFPGIAPGVFWHHAGWTMMHDPGAYGEVLIVARPEDHAHLAIPHEWVAIVPMSDEHKALLNGWAVTECCSRPAEMASTSTGLRCPSCMNTVGWDLQG